MQCNAHAAFTHWPHGAEPRYCGIRYGNAVKHILLEMAAAAPRAQLDPRTYMGPALRPTGWHPETGKAWECWAMPTYSF